MISGRGEIIHSHPRARSVGGRQHIRVIKRLKILRLRIHRIISQTAAPEIVGLRVAGRFVKPRVIKPVVQKIDVIKKLLNPALTRCGACGNVVGNVRMKKSAGSSNLRAEVARREVCRSSRHRVA